jgi:hypothetical protein
MDRHIQGSFLWTAHNEIEAKWDYIKAWDMGFINKTELAPGQYRPYPDFAVPNATVPVEEEPIEYQAFMQ